MPRRAASSRNPAFPFVPERQKPAETGSGRDRTSRKTDGVKNLRF